MHILAFLALSALMPTSHVPRALPASTSQAHGDEKQIPEREADALAAEALGRDLANAKQLTKQHLDRYVSAKEEVRRQLFSMSPKDLGFSDANRLAFVKMVMQHEGKNSHAEGWLDPALGDEDTAILLAKLRAVPGSSRVYCLQLLWRAKDKARVADVVAEYLHDPDREVRVTAVRALGFLGGRKHVPAILETYKKVTTKENDAWFAESLAQLGEVDLTLRCVRSSMASQNWNLRWVAADSLRHVQSARVVPLAMELLETEFGQTMEEHAMHSVGDRVFISLCQSLEKNTKQKHGSDVLAWQRWWNGHCKEFGGAPVRVNEDAVARTQEAYWKLFPFRKTRID
jgi:HEAT repeat protein